MSRPFIFQQFTIRQDKAAFKVGTDSVLLGAWTHVHGTGAMLDIGTGTGLLALMLAQRSNATVLAIETDPLSSAQAAENFANSPWAGRLSSLHTDAETFFRTSSEKFDLVITNPPYFSGSLLPADRRKELARHTSKLDFRLLASAIPNLLKPEGRFAFILPCDGFEKLVFLLSENGIFPLRTCEVKSFSNGPVIRMMGEFGAQKATAVTESIYLYEDGRRQRSALYSGLTKEFYLSS